MADSGLITTYSFSGQEFLIKMNVVNYYLEISITDKQTGEEWQCSYDNTYIESITQKTGNFKQFDIFTTMLKSGLLKTSESISLDLLTYEDLEALRVRRIKSSSTKMALAKRKNNRRYLILIYNVEFDRILYPLPLEYCGLPDPTVMQATIKRLETELFRIKEENENKSNRDDSKQIALLQRRIDELSIENNRLKAENRQLSQSKKNKSTIRVHTLQNAISNLEKSVLTERRTHQRFVQKLKEEKNQLLREIEKLKAENSRKILKKQLSRSPIRSKTSANNPRMKAVVRKTSQEKISRSISPSPPRSKRDLYDEMTRMKGTGISRKARSRSSSYSSFRSDEGKIYKNKNFRSSSRERAYYRVPPLDNSRSTSSDENSAASTHKSRSSKILEAKLKSSEEEFRSLEQRIGALQKMLQENISCVK